jgi:hypothetical protein
MLTIAPTLALPGVTHAAIVANPLCPDNTAIFEPDSGKDITVPPGYTVSVFKAGLNFPTGIAFRGDKQNFEVYVLESGHGLPSACNEQSQFGSGDFDPANPFTPDILVFDSSGKLLRTLGKPTATGGFQVAGPAVDRIRAWHAGRATVRERFEPGHARTQRPEQQLAHRDR